MRDQHGGTSDSSMPHDELSHLRSGEPFRSIISPFRAYPMDNNEFGDKALPTTRELHLQVYDRVHITRSPTDYFSFYATK